MRGPFLALGYTTTSNTDNTSPVQGMGPYRYHGLSGQDETLEKSTSGALWWSDNKLATIANHSDYLAYEAHIIAAATTPLTLGIDQGIGDAYTHSKTTANIVYAAAKAVYD